MFLLLLAGLASASSNYPGAVADDLGLNCTPQCTICHATNGGGGGTVTADFGVAMMDRGLTGDGQTAALIAALDAMTTDGVDSDGDGVSDVDQLIAGADPNTGDSFCDVVGPTYGCFSHAPTGGGLLGLVLGAAAIARRRPAR